MAGKISEYANAVATFADGDLVDVSKRLSTSPDVFQSQKLEFAQFQAFIQANASNILNTNGLTLGGMYSHNLNSNYLTFTNGTLNISQGSLLVQAETNLGSTAVLFKKQNGDTMWNFLDNGNLNIGGNSTIDLGSNILTFDGDLILNSNVNAPNLPTASTGLSAGDFWNENGVVRVGTSGTGPSSIYTADDTIGTGRVATLTDTFKIQDSTNTYSILDLKSTTNGRLIMDDSIVRLQRGGVWLDIEGAKSQFEGGLVVSSGGNIVLDVTPNAGNGLFHSSASQGSYMQYVNSKVRCYSSEIHFNILDINYGRVSANETQFYGNNFVVSPSSTMPFQIGTEDISLQGQTAIKGIGTSGSSALAIYDNDTTPVKVFEVLDDSTIKTNGNAGFTGTGAYTNFTIENGIITNAS